jgi:hypothetical protein
MNPDSTKRRFSNKTIYGAITIIIVAIAAVATWQVYNYFLSPNLPPMTLTLIGRNGTQIVLHASDIAKLASYTGRAGLETSDGSISSIGNYTGVQLTTLCNQVGGIGANDSVKIVASDGYAMVFSHNQTCGNGFVLYDPVTGKVVSNVETLTLVVAYFKNGTKLSTDDGGPLRLVILGKDELLTDGHYWVKWVTTITVMPGIVDWTLLLKDVSKVNSTRVLVFNNVTRSYFEAGEVPAPHCHGVGWTDNSSNVWTGIPLWLLVGLVANWKWSMESGSFNSSLASSNSYDVVVISRSGGNRTFPSSVVANNGSGMLVANKLNGAVLPDKYWPLTLVGPGVSSDDMVVNIVEIELVFLGS